jgi:phosphoglycolate phosphatase
MNTPVRAVIFDLDGTLVQTRVASWDVFARVNERFGLGVDSPDEYFDLFRGNVFASIRERCHDDAHAAEVKGYFLQLLRDEYTPPLVPGVSEVVRRLAGSCTLAVMSSNATAVLRRVLEAGGLAFCFAHVFGGDVMPDKRAAIRAFLADSASGFGRRCSADYDETGPRPAPDHGGTVLVTDTAGDVRDALEVGIRAVGVAWGMHSVDELRAAGAEFVALWPQELAAHLLGDAAARPPDEACAVPAGAGARPAAASAATGCACGCAGAAGDSAAAPGHPADASPAGASANPGSGCRCTSGGTGGGPGTGVDAARSHGHDAELARAARARRDRRRAAADRVAAATGGGARRAADDELLAAIRRLVRP